MFEFLIDFLVQSGVPSPSDIEGKVILTTLLERNKYAAIVIDIGLVAIPTILGGAAAAIIGKTSYSAAKEAIRSTKEALLFLSAGGLKSLGQGPTKPTGPATEKSPSLPDEPAFPRDRKIITDIDPRVVQEVTKTKADISPVQLFDGKGEILEKQFEYEKYKLQERMIGVLEKWPEKPSQRKLII